MKKWESPFSIFIEIKPCASYSYSVEKEDL